MIAVNIVDWEIKVLHPICPLLRWYLKIYDTGDNPVLVDITAPQRSPLHQVSIYLFFNILKVPNVF